MTRRRPEELSLGAQLVHLVGLAMGTEDPQKTLFAMRDVLDGKRPSGVDLSADLHWHQFAKDVRTAWSKPMNAKKLLDIEKEQAPVIPKYRRKGMFSDPDPEEAA